VNIVPDQKGNRKSELKQESCIEVFMCEYNSAL